MQKAQESRALAEIYQTQQTSSAIIMCKHTVQSSCAIILCNPPVHSYCAIRLLFISYAPVDSFLLYLSATRIVYK